MRHADVVIPVHRDVEVARACVESVLERSGEALGLVLLVDDRGLDDTMGAMLRDVRDADARVRLLTNEKNLGFVAAANRGLLASERDVVLLDSDTRVTNGWLDELLAVLDADERIGAVSPLSNNATLCSVPSFGQGVVPEAVDAARLELGGLPRWTEVPTGVGFCLLMRRALLDVAGALDPAYGRGYNEENDWCQRIQALGHVVARANRAFVYHHGQVSFGGERDGLDVYNARRLHQRAPQYLEQNASFEAGPHARVAAVGVRAALGDLRVCLDASHVTAPYIHGTSAYAVELAQALLDLGAVDLVVRPASAQMAAFSTDRGLHCCAPGEAVDADVVHHPSQVYARADAARLLLARGHLVLTWQDLIA